MFKSVAVLLSTLAVTQAYPALNKLNDTTPYGPSDEFGVVCCDLFFRSEFDSFSCHNTTAIPEQDSCCFENYGIIMQTQFWDYNEKYLEVAVNGTASDVKSLKKQIAKQNTTEQDVTFTIHGLWNDLCDGSYKQFCNPSLEISDKKDNITHVIVDEFNEPKLYQKMIKYWVNNVKSNVADESSISLWEHEYNKHGTCMNTLDPKCFTDNYKKFENVVSFYKRVVSIWETLKTYAFLKKAGIVPSLTEQYKLADVEAALAVNHDGSKVYVGCKNGAIDEIWYYHNLRGNVLTGTLKASDSLTNSTCPSWVWYIPK